VGYWSNRRVITLEETEELFNLILETRLTEVEKIDLDASQRVLY